MAKKQNDSKNKSRHLAKTGYANEILTRFKDGFVTPLQNLISVLENNFKIEVTPAVLHNCVTHCGIETIDAFRDSQRPGYAHDVKTYGVWDNSIEEKVNAVKAAIKPFQGFPIFYRDDGQTVLFAVNSPELMEMVNIDEKGIVTIKEETIDFINERAMVFTKTKDGKRLCDILYEITPLLQEFLDIIWKYIKSGKPIPPKLQAGYDYWFPARLFDIVEDKYGKKTIKPVEFIHFDLEDLE